MNTYTTPGTYYTESIATISTDTLPAQLQGDSTAQDEDRAIFLTVRTYGNGTVAQTLYNDGVDTYTRAYLATQDADWEDWRRIVRLDGNSDVLLIPQGGTGANTIWGAWYNLTGRNGSRSSQQSGPGKARVVAFGSKVVNFVTGDGVFCTAQEMDTIIGTGWDMGTVLLLVESADYRANSNYVLTACYNESAGNFIVRGDMTGTSDAVINGATRLNFIVVRMEGSAL